MAPEKKRKSAFGTSERQQDGVKAKKPRVKPTSADLSDANASESDQFEGFDNEASSSEGGDAGALDGVKHQREDADNAQARTSQGSSRESHAKQKVATQERKAAKPNADILQRSKKIWERLRLKSHVPLPERKKLVAELFEIVTGRVKDFVLKHDAVRIIQTAIKYANLEQRKMIARELKGEYKTLAESRYAKFLIGKLLVHGDQEIRDIIVPEFNGHVRRMIKHPEASWILDDVYRGAASGQQKATLLREWYGAEFSLFKTSGKEKVSSKLSDVLAEAPEKRSPIMRSLHDLINQLIQKKTTAFTMLHDAMLEYFSNAKPGSEEVTDFLELLKGDEEGDLMKNLAFTKSGSKVVCYAFAHGTAKDRKQMLRSYKDVITMLSYDPYGHLIILTAYETIDDTVLTAKSIFPELFGKTDEAMQENIANASVNIHARIPLLYLPAGRAKWLLSPETIDLLNEIDTMRKATSKKDPETRRRELLEKESPSLIKAVENDAKTLCQSSFGWQFIGDVLVECSGPKARAGESIAEVVSGDPSEEGHPANIPVAGKTLRTLVAGGKYDVKAGKIQRVEPPLDFHNTFFAFIKDHVKSWATGPSSFVILDMLNAEGFLYQKELLEILKKHRKTLVGAAEASSKDDKSAKVSKKAVKGETGKKVGEKTAPHGGNKGAAMILERMDES
ncbi:MAG: hypothetical protein M4579_001068 [Chaenotheca gracillima]|nr:MAG: hypothetical protein M4579_001068 [Chaenotheca gracillima]